LRNNWLSGRFVRFIVSSPSICFYMIKYSSPKKANCEGELDEIEDLAEMLDLDLFEIDPFLTLSAPR
jgi:hypothetical protein